MYCTKTCIVTRNNTVMISKQYHSHMKYYTHIADMISDSADGKISKEDHIIVDWTTVTSMTNISIIPTDRHVYTTDSNTKRFIASYKTNTYFVSMAINLGMMTNVIHYNRVVQCMYLILHMIPTLLSIIVRLKVHSTTYITLDFAASFNLFMIRIKLGRIV